MIDVGLVGRVGSRSVGKKAQGRNRKDADRRVDTGQVNEPAAPKARRGSKVVGQDSDFARAAEEIGQAMRKLHDLGGIDDIATSSAGMRRTWESDRIRSVAVDAADQTPSDTGRSMVAWLAQLAQRQDLIEQAREGCARWLQNEGRDIHYALSDVRLAFRSHALCFAHARLPYPYVETRLDLLIADQEIGYYRLITRLDGSVDDDYFVLH
jgi:hypothetical protein